MKRERFGPLSELQRRLLDQLELQLEELEATATEDDCAAEAAAAKADEMRAGAADFLGDLANSSRPGSVPNE